MPTSRRRRARTSAHLSMKMAGFQQLVRGEPMRGKFRKSFENPEPFVPGKMEEVSFEMPDINHTFRRGHRIMVQVQSSWFPLTDLNPQTFVNIPDAKPSDFQAGHRARVPLAQCAFGDPGAGGAS